MNDADLGHYTVSGQDDCCGAKDISQATPAYRRALVAVVVLNLGYGVLEASGGFLAHSQALKADALDFLGDGTITFLALLALSWTERARAQAAMLQGLFLGLLGLGVLAATVYRVFVLHEPEAELMGLFGIGALTVNVAAALLLLPHRRGDSGMRAVWIFSRNDALGNVAVVAAAGLVWFTGSPWPDIIVAFGIACLFLHGAWDIVADARRDLRQTV